MSLSFCFISGSLVFFKMRALNPPVTTLALRIWWARGDHQFPQGLHGGNGSLRFKVFRHPALFLKLPQPQAKAAFPS